MSLRPLPFREVKRRLERCGFTETAQKGSHVKFIKKAGALVLTAIVRNIMISPLAPCEAYLGRRKSLQSSGKSWIDDDAIRGDAHRLVVRALGLLKELLHAVGHRSAGVDFERAFVLVTN